MEELASLTEKDLRDAGATKDGLTNLRVILMYVGYAQVEAEQEERKVAASYYELLDDVKAAYNTLLLENMSLADGTAVAEVLARASARLLHYLTGELEDLGEPKDYEEPEDYEDILASVAGAIDRGRRQLIDAWLEGAAATKKLLDVVDEVKAKEVGDARAENRVDVD
ncbi:MAG: hypothetical protein M3M97_05795 [Actinomycetota bacterium]|nr:hypothetical protein [Actinomycetota bacterium]